MPNSIVIGLCCVEAKCFAYLTNIKVQIYYELYNETAYMFVSGFNRKVKFYPSVIKELIAVRTSTNSCVKYKNKQNNDLRLFALRGSILSCWPIGITVVGT
jgi:hypothetical protein